jgi:RNA polymerase sigma-70 factor (ECF subfamily)
MLAAIIDGICRREGAAVLAGLIRRYGDFELAEDALQDAYLKALERWPADGLPERPGAWLTTVAQHRAVDLLRRRHTGPLYVEDLPDTAAPESAAAVHPADVSGVEDDRLRLLFTCCHPALAPQAQAALALRTLCGLSTREIARAFLEPEATTAQRLVRAKRKIAEARIPYVVPHREDLPARLEIVLGVVYLVFNEGYAATEEPGLVRSDVCEEAIRLARLVVELLPQEPEARGLLALMLLHHARRAARLDADGVLVPLEQQDRALWDAAGIAAGLAELGVALAMRRRGPYQTQAAIAALHAQAASAGETDWPQIAALYAAMLREHPGPVLELNAAVAVAMAEGLEQGLARVERLAQQGELANYYLLPAAHADLLRRLGRHAEAALQYRAALALVRTTAERSYLERRLAEVEAATR